MSKRKLFIACVGAMVVVACFGGERTGTSGEELTTGVALATYSNIPGVGADGSKNHYATTSTVTVADTTCGGVGNAFRTTTAWEEESFGGSNNPVALWLGNECAFNPVTINYGGAARQITNALMGGNAPEWNPASFGGPTMFWVQEPTLVPIVDPAGNISGTRAIALVGLVAPNTTGSFPTGIAISLSLDGGQTWGHPHLIDPVPFISGIDDLAVTAGTHVDSTAGGYVAKFNTNTFDVYVTWSDPNGHRWFEAFSYQKGGAWTPHRLGAHIDLSANTVINPGGVPRVIEDMSIVSGTVNDAPHNSFVMVQWPTVGDYGALPYFIDCPIGSGSIANQIWKGAVSYDYGTTWKAMPNSHAVSLPWPVCVGFCDNTSECNFKNPGRSSLAFDPNTHSVIDAVAMPDTFDAIAGTYIEANGFLMLNFGFPPLTVAPVFHTTHSSTFVRQDQFLPVVGAARGASGPQGDVTIAWVDSFEDPLHQNGPSGLYAVTSQTFSISAPGFSPVARVWTIPPAPPADMFSVVGGGPWIDTLGRHNSLAVQGFSWASFAGDVTHLTGGIPYTSMDTVSISPL